MLSSDINVIAAEINTWKIQAGQAVFEIGKRLKHVKENDLAHGQWIEWLQTIDIETRTAQRMIRAFDQFGDTTTSSHLPAGKIFEMLSLPESVDREQFIEKEHYIPSKGENKKVDEMTVREIREVTKALREAEERAERAQNESDHYQGLWNEEKNKSPQIITKTQEVVPERIQKELDELKFQNKHLRHGLDDAKTKLQEHELRNTDGFDEVESQRQLKKMQHEADLNTVNIRLAYKQFIEKAAISEYLHAAIAIADKGEKERLTELVESAESVIGKTKQAIRGRKVSVINE